MLPTLIESATTVLTFASLFYFIAALWSARSFVRHRRTPVAFTPAVSILKPVKGLDPGMAQAFASHCLQDYAGEYEILFGVSSLDDSAVAAIHKLQADFPQHRISLIQCPEKLGPNGKIGTVAQLAPHARYEYLIVNDSDIRVSRHYLSRIMGDFVTPQHNKPVGMVTAPYRGRAHKTIGSRMEALGISTDFFPGVLTALKLDGEIRFGLGSTLAVSKPALDAIGGFAPLAQSLADDYQLGLRIAHAGFAVVLSREVVETSVPAYSLSAFFAHQLRWSRGIRDSRKLGYLGLVFTFGLPWAIFNAIASGFSIESLALLSLTCLARVTLALSVGVGILYDRQVLRDLWLLPLRDLAAMWVWIWSFAGNTVIWRGESFTLENGNLIPDTKSPQK